MSAVDARFPELDLFLQGWRSRLNRRYLSGEALAAVAVAAPVAWFLAALIGRSGPARVGLWVGLTLVVVGVFVAVKARSRLSRHQAASWLDERAGTVGVFRAASECLDQDPPSRAAEQVLAEADRARALMGGRMAPKLPWKQWALRAAGGALAAAVSLVVLGVDGLSPSFGSPLSQRPPAESTTPDAGEVSSSDAQELTPQEAARRLFPEDARLAALAEQALASGDPEALNSLLEQNAAGQTGQSPGSAGSGTERKPAASEQGRRPEQQRSGDGTGGEGEGEPGKPGEPGSASESSDPQQGTNSKPGSSSPSSEKQPNPSGAAGAQQGQTGTAPGSSRNSRSGSGEGPPSNSGGAPGIGHSEQALGVQPAPGVGGRTLALKETKPPGMFEYVLPGTESKVPRADVVAQSQRSAEAVISRTAPPLEYENTIRDYFLSLSQEVSP